jgi:hypothetical protein
LLLTVAAMVGGASFFSNAASPSAAETPWSAAQTLRTRAESRPSRAGRERERDADPFRVPEGVWDLGAHDMNGDQRVDLVIATGGPGSSGGSVSLLLNPGGAADFLDWQTVVLPTKGDYGRVAVGDIDGDEVEDVAALTFASHVLRWWLLRADHSVKDERSISFAGAPSSGRTCPGPELQGPPLTLSSLGFADLDVDHQLELAVGAYASATEGAAFLFSYQRASGCFELHPGFDAHTRGSLRARFFDVDDDGALDLVTSHYALARPLPGDVEDCAGCLEWGQWRRTSGGPPRPLVARFSDRKLLAATPTPELNVVDFDVLQTPAGARFALAGSAHLCPAEDCWSAGRGGFVSVIDASGNELSSADDWKRRAESAPPVEQARLLPRAVSFSGALGAPSLTIAFWWATRRKNTPCGRVTPCAGPLTIHAAGSDEPRVLGDSAFAQALAFIDGAGAEIALEKSCQPAPRSLVSLPEAGVTAIIGVDLKGRSLPRAAYSWVPGSRVVALATQPASQSGEVCIRYAITRGPLALVVADSNEGLVRVEL